MNPHSNMHKNVFENMNILSYYLSLS